MAEHLKVDEPDHRNRLDSMVQGVLGTPLDRPEGPLKVTGRAAYAAEALPAAVAHGVLVRATEASGRLSGFENEAEVRAMPGVLAIVSGPRFLRNPAQGGAGEATVQGVEEIAYLGQPVALVVAETLEAARHGAERLRPRIDAGPAAVDPETAEERDLPKRKQQDKGDLDRAMAEAASSVDVTYTTPGHNSAAMEPHAALAVWEGDRLTLTGSRRPAFSTPPQTGASSTRSPRSTAPARARSAPRARPWACRSSRTRWTNLPRRSAWTR